jgi:hypothetical protein
MMRLILTPKLMEEIDKKTHQTARSKIGSKILPKIMKMKNIAVQDVRLFNPNTQLY